MTCKISRTGKAGEGALDIDDAPLQVVQTDVEIGLHGVHPVAEPLIAPRMWASCWLLMVFWRKYRVERVS